MTVRFEDFEHEHNPRNGERIGDRAAMMVLLEELRRVRPPYACQFVSDGGAELIVGIGDDFGCVQYSATEGMPPYLMAVVTDASTDDAEMEILAGGTPSPIDGRYRLPFATLAEVVAEFATSGSKSDKVTWEELR
jgi:hypothetical protein